MHKSQNSFLIKLCAWYPPSNFKHVPAVFENCNVVRSTRSIAVHCMHVGMLRLQDDLQMDEFPLGEDMHHIPGEELFDFMADKLVKFATKLGKK